MIKAHVISDLYLYDNEWADPIDETLPECDIVFVNGNNGSVKRSMLFAETLCKKYPSVQVVFLNGRRELIRQKVRTQISDGLTTRKFYSELWPSNLHYAFEKPIHLTINNTKLDILCMHGYPYITDEVDKTLWESSSWYKFVNHGLTDDPNYCRPLGASDASRGDFPIWSTPELCRIDHDKEFEIVKEWCNNTGDTIKILATSLSPIADTSLPNINYTLFSGISVDHWICSGYECDLTNNSFHLYGNPGRGESARGRTFII